MSDWITLLICGIIFLLLCSVQIIIKAKNPLKKTFFSMLKGVATLAAVNALGAFTGVTLPVSLLSLAIAAVIGMPGVTAMLIFNAFL